MIPTLFLHALIVAQTPSPPLSVAFDVPHTVVAGLPLVLPYRQTNATDLEIYTKEGVNQASWAEFRLMSAQGATVLRSLPEVEIPQAPRANLMVQYGHRIPRGDAGAGVLIPRLDTAGLTPGAYTLDVRIVLPITVGGSAQEIRQTLRYPVEVRADRDAVVARCEALLAQIHERPFWEGADEPFVRELFRADRSVVLPLLLKDRPRWSHDKVAYVAEGLAPHASPADARAMRAFAEDWPAAFESVLPLLRHSPDAEVVGIAEGFKRANGIDNP